MTLPDAAVAVDEHRDRDAEQWPVRVLYVLTVLADEHRIIHVHLRRVRLQLGLRIVDRYTDHDQLIAIPLLQFDQRGNLFAARRAPGRPEVEDDDLALERR